MVSNTQDENYKSDELLWTIAVNKHLDALWIVNTISGQREQKSSYEAARLCLRRSVISWNVCGCRPCSRARWRPLPQRTKASPHRQAPTRQQGGRGRRSFRRGRDGRQLSGRCDAPVRVLRTAAVTVTCQRRFRHVKAVVVVVGRHARHSISMTSQSLHAGRLLIYR